MRLKYVDFAPTFFPIRLSCLLNLYTFLKKRLSNWLFPFSSPQGPLHLVHVIGRSKSQIRHTIELPASDQGSRRVSAVFDSEAPQGPCFALGLDTRTALLLAFWKVDGSSSSSLSFKRIGRAFSNSDVFQSHKEKDDQQRQQDQEEGKEKHSPIKGKANTTSTAVTTITGNEERSEKKRKGGGLFRKLLNARKENSRSSSTGYSGSGDGGGSGKPAVRSSGYGYSELGFEKARAMADGSSRVVDLY